MNENKNELEKNDSASSKIVRKSHQEGFEKRSENLCINCGVNKKADGLDYCPACVKKLKSKKAPALAWVFFAAIIVACVFGLFMCIVNFAPAKRIFEARTAFKENRLADSFNAYEDAFSLADELNGEIGFNAVSVGKKIRTEEADVLSKLYIDYYGYTFLSKYFSDDEIKADPAMKKHYDAFVKYSKSYGLVSEYVEDCTAGKITPEAALKAIKAKEKEAGDGIFWILYAESYIEVTYNNADSEKQLEHLDRVKELCPDADWYYNGCYRALYYTLGRYDECVEYCEKELENNRNAYEAYLTKLRIAFLKGTKEDAENIIDEYIKYNSKDASYTAMQAMLSRRYGDFENAEKLCSDFVNSGSATPEIYRQQALNLLAKGDYNGAYDTAYNAYVTAYNLYQYGENDVLTSELLETIYVCAVLYSEKGDGTAENNGDLAGTLNSFEGYDEIISDNAKAILSGEKTVRQVLAEGTGDLG